MYGISKNELSNIIGLGVIRSQIFRDNGIDFNEVQQLELWSKIISQLEVKKQEWIMFTNGLKEDYEFAVKILEYMGKSEEINNKIVKPPVDDEELVRTISNFKGIIAARMHANIIAYALGIPTVGIVWNPKLAWFGRIIGVASRFFAVHQCNAINIVNELESAIKQGYNHEFFVNYKETTYISLSEYMDEFLDKKLYYVEKKNCFSKKKTIVFGTGRVTKLKIEFKFYEGIEYFIDNDEKKKNTMLFGKMIYTPEKLLEDFDNIFVIVNTFDFYNDMVATLIKMGLKETLHYAPLGFYCAKTGMDVYVSKEWR